MDSTDFFFGKSWDEIAAKQKAEQEAAEKENAEWVKTLSNTWSGLVEGLQNLINELAQEEEDEASAKEGSPLANADLLFVEAEINAFSEALKRASDDIKALGAKLVHLTAWLDGIRPMINALTQNKTE